MKLTLSKKEFFMIKFEGSMSNSVHSEHQTFDKLILNTDLTHCTGLYQNELM